MTNGDKLRDLRERAVKNGYPRNLDKQYHVAVLSRTDGREYIGYNTDHALLFDPSWVRALVGDESVETGWFDDKLEAVVLPAFQWAMVQEALIRGSRGDVIGWLYEQVTTQDA